MRYGTPTSYTKRYSCNYEVQVPLQLGCTAGRYSYTDEVHITIRRYEYIYIEEVLTATPPRYEYSHI
jgi:hypothetical protein